MNTTTTEKTWKAIRIIKTFTYDELQTITGSSYAVLRRFISLLVNVGYVKAVGRVDGARKKRVYRLVKDTGPKHPRKTMCLYDPNTKEVIPRKIKEPSSCG